MIMERQEEKRLPKTYNTAIFIAFVVGFLLHTAIIFFGGIGWSHIAEDGRELRDRIAALEKV